MTPWHLLPPLAVLCALGAWLSYSPAWKGSPLVPWAMCVLGGLTAWGWGWASARTPDPSKLYVYSMVWDCIILACYVVLPALFAGVRLSPAGWLGVGLCVAGAAVVKVWGAA